MPMLGRYTCSKFTQYFLSLYQTAASEPLAETSPLKLLVRAALAANEDDLSYKEFTTSCKESHKYHPIIRLAGK